MTKEKTVPLSFFKNYKKAMQDQLKRKELLIKELREEKEVWRKTAMKQSNENYDLRKKLR